jgi:hypothetical protein
MPTARDAAEDDAVHGSLTVVTCFEALTTLLAVPSTYPLAYKLATLDDPGNGKTQAPR